ncbi:diguanylate cyclase [Deinococcus sp. KSM4-11]|uniref:diguanylate cyclase n=1 Tax=Deinococcus sp. KSM4-11 TaxID=2568654 RepID=UPI001454CE91|nr:diguanylate cyclase [Deinococcus sp. KSM4-11]
MDDLLLGLSPRAGDDPQADVTDSPAELLALHAARCRELAQLGSSEDLVDACRAYADTAHELEDDAQEVEALSMLATAAQQCSQFNVAVNALQREVELRARNGDRVGQGLCLNNIGMVWSYLGAHADALSALYQCQKLCDQYSEIPDDVRAACNVNIGRIFLTMAQPAQALSFLVPGLEQARRCGDLETELGAMGMSGLAHKDLGQFEQAQKILTQAIGLARDHDLTHHLIDLYDNVGQVHFDQGALDEAHDMFSQSAYWATETSDVQGRVNALLSLGRLEFRRSHAEVARASLDEALALATTHELHASKLSILESLFQGLEAQAKLAEAYPHLRAYRDLERELFTEENERKTQSMTARFEAERARRETEMYRQLNDASQLARIQAEETVRLRTAELEAVQIEIVNRLGLAAEYRDDKTGQHTRRVGELSASLAEAMGLPQEEIDLLRWAARLHDIGKIGVGDDILLKSGRYSPEEFERMKLHTVIGAKVLEGSKSRLLRVAEEIAMTHHERWDGSGYPRGLASTDIPISGRIVAVADVFDALITERPYKEAWPVQSALDEMIQQAGSQFDPDIVEHLLRLIQGGAAPHGSTSGPTSTSPELPARRVVTPNAETLEVKEMIDRAWAVRRSDSRVGADLAARAMEIARNGTDERVLGLAHRTQGYYCFDAGNYEEALAHLSQGMDIGVRLDDPGLQADCANFIAAVYNNLQDYAKATDQLSVALRIARDHMDRLREAQLLHNLGNLSYRNRDWTQAQQFVQESLDLFSDLGVLHGQEDALHTMATIAFDLDQIELAAQAAQEAVSMARQTGNLAVMNLGLATAGKAAARLGDPERGKVLLREAIEQSVEADLPTNEPWNRFELGRLHQTLGEYAEARAYYLDGLSAAQGRGMRDLEMLIYQQLSEIAAHEGQHADAFHFYRQHHEIEREIHDQVAAMKTRSMMSQLEVERAKSEAEIYRLRTIELASANEALERSNTEKSSLVNMLEEQSRLLERQLSEDGLTGLYNRRHIENLLQDEYTQARVTRRALSVAMADIDHFKQINDQFSHLVGDQVLRTVAQLFQAAVRSMDSVGRYGGEEFLFVFPNTPLAQGISVCERVQDLVRSYDWTQIHPRLVVTLSIGVACEPLVANHEKLISVADEQLYRAKHSGRNQICAALPD